MTTERLAALKAGDTLDFWGNAKPKCPHCGTDFDIAEHEAWRLYEEGEHEVECYSCGLDYTVSTRVSFSFSTDTEDPDGT
jgi:hypothetical protein